MDRRQVAIAIRLVDSTQSRLYRPVRPAQPGQSQQLLGETLALNIVNSYSRLAQTQGTFLSTWMQYQAARMRLQRELGIMELDQEGSWVDEPLPPVVEMLHEIEEAELLNTVEPTETEDDPQASDVAQTEGDDLKQQSTAIEEAPEEDLDALEKLNRKLVSLQQNIEDAVLKRAKARMDLELEKSLAKPPAEAQPPGDLTNEENPEDSTDSPEAGT